MTSGLHSPPRAVLLGDLPASLARSVKPKREALVQARLSPSSRAPRAQVHAPSRLASPTVRPRVIDLPGARMRRSMPLDLPMPSLLL